MRHSLNFRRWKDCKAVAADLRRIYSAPPADRVAAYPDAFEEKWAGKIYVHRPGLARGKGRGDPVLWPRSGDLKIICTTNTLESLNRVIRKSIKTRGTFPTDKPATKLIYLAIRNLERDGRNVREWLAARNQFARILGERFDA